MLDNFTLEYSRILKHQIQALVPGKFIRDDGIGDPILAYAEHESLTRVTPELRGELRYFLP